MSNELKLDLIEKNIFRAWLDSWDKFYRLIKYIPHVVQLCSSTFCILPRIRDDSRLHDWKRKCVLSLNAWLNQFIEYRFFFLCLGFFSAIYSVLRGYFSFTSFKSITNCLLNMFPFIYNFHVIFFSFYFVFHDTKRDLCRENYLSFSFDFIYFFLSKIWIH